MPPQYQSQAYSQALASSRIDEHRVRALQLGVLDPDTIVQMSVAEIRSTLIYDMTTFQPNFGAINDPRLGVLDKASECVTCRAGMDGCPGHFGHIVLNSPVYHGGLLTYVCKFLKMVCFNCSKLLAFKEGDGKADEEKQEILKIKSRKLRFTKLLKMSEGHHLCDSQSGGCGYKQPKYRKGSLKIDIEYRDENFDQTRDRKETLWPQQALKVLARITDSDCELMGLDPAIGRPDWAIIRNLAVAPPQVRPCVTMSSTMRCEDDLTYAYQQILKMNNILKEQIEKGANQTIVNELRTTLQYFVATLMENPIAGQPVQKHKSGKPIKSVRSRLKGKEGRLRGNLMGKRVDFSSRTVITPDPNLQLDQLGVPLKVATGLTVPEVVTSQNIEKLRRLVNNGPCQWPGAKYIIRHDERQIDLSQLRNRSDVHLECGYKVERHLQDGDYVLLNRQPSLHKMSIMGHRVKVLPFSTFRLNLSVTTPYNADFDGDEMNIHVPQSYESLAEIKEIMAVPRQIISPQANKPCMGIVQDSLLGTMQMTTRDTFIDKELAFQLFMWVPDTMVTGELKKLPQPAILKPRPLWTGKQLWSMLIPNVNLARTKDRNNLACHKDSNILIERGELLSGVLTKGVIGPTGQGLGHIIMKEYGHQQCANFLSSVQTFVNNWLVEQGFTVGVQDIIVHEKHVAKGIADTLFKFKRRVSHIVQKSQLGKLKSQPGKSMQESFEVQINKKLNDARDKSGNMAVDGLSSSNRLINMVMAGSKGSNINISQIMACVGQQNVEGKRIPFGFNKRSLPHFTKDDFGPESKGFVESSYLSGLKPDEFYFHAMGGREGLIDTAVKTAETGYISRRLIKALEDVMVQYDGTVRGSGQNIVQFLYGEDGIAGESIEDVSIDLLKAGDKDLENECLFPHKGASEAQDRKLSEAVDDEVFQSLDLDTVQLRAIQAEFRGIQSDRESLRNDIMRTTCDDQIHLPINASRLITNAKSQFKIKPNSKSNLKPEYVTSALSQLLNSLNVIPGAKSKNNQLLYNSDLNARRLFNIYMRHQLCSKNVIYKERLSAPAFDWLLGEIKSRFERSTVAPGEMVGSVAAQSLGEPATQMTLNTFHFAGISAKNVTLGVPRFKEIINVSNKIKTPGLKIFLEPKYQKKESKVSKLGMLIEHTTLSHVIAQSAIYYDPNPERTIIPEDMALVNLYNEVPVLDNPDLPSLQSPWLLRFELDRDKMVQKALTMSQIDKKLTDTFQNQINVMVSDENSDKQVVRIRLGCIEDDDQETVASYIKNEFEPVLLNDLALKGFPEIQKVTFTKHQEHKYCTETGKVKMSDDNWVIETDGTALAKILTVKRVDASRTVSNDNLEVLNVLGCEAARQSVINELRFVLSSYGIYVNYRHMTTLVDVMTLRGKLTSITRHGINRVDTSGPLRKCSFEETVEILLEGAVFAEKDPLVGISENIIMGQLGPFGTGSFGITIDQQCLELNAKPQFGLNGQLDVLTSDYDYMAGGNTPMLQGDLPIHATPMCGITPILEHGGPLTSTHGPDSAHSGFITPGLESGMFSPRPDAMLAVDSPGYASPNAYGTNASPGYGIAGQPGSPGALYASPIYGGGSAGVGSPAQPGYTNGHASPNYGASIGSPHNAGAYAPASPIYKQDNSSRVPAYSPVYQGSVSSPAYGNAASINQMRIVSGAAINQVSPSYSPSATVKSPAYTSAYGSGFPSPASSSIQSPHYTPPQSTFTSNQITPGISGIKSPYYMPPSKSFTGGISSPSYNQSSAEVSPDSAVKKMQSPVYNPASPCYAPTNLVKDEKEDESD